MCNNSFLSRLGLAQKMDLGFRVYFGFTLGLAQKMGLGFRGLEFRVYFGFGTKDGFRV